VANLANLKARLLGGWVGDRLLRDTMVDAVTELGPCFRRIALSGSSLRGVSCSAGDKVQVFVPGQGTRTFSPFAFDPENGRLELVAFLHGTSPATSWARSLAVGASVRLFGPRSSIALEALSGPVALFGDETSFGVARSLQELSGARGSTFCFEVATVAEATPACVALDLPVDALVERREDGGHLPQIAQRLASATAAGGTMVLTGGAPSIQALRKHWRSNEGAAAKQKIKAYWAPGKVGPD
jgi:NADPH-dependent ferric siderophore reductase